MPARSKPDGFRRPDALARAAERFQHRDPRRAEAGVGDETDEGGRRFAVRGEREDARARVEVRADEIEGAAVEGEEHGLGERPAEPRCREAEGRWGRDRDDLL